MAMKGSKMSPKAEFGKDAVNKKICGHLPRIQPCFHDNLNVCQGMGLETEQDMTTRVPFFYTLFTVHIVSFQLVLLFSVQHLS